MTTMSPSSARIASYPFDDRSADIIIRTVDSVHFYIDSLILRQASPVFSAILSLPHARSEDDAAIQPPVMDVPEDSKTLFALLLLIYFPVATEGLNLYGEPTSVAEAEKLLATAVKYELAAAVDEYTKRLRVALAREPLRLWAIASRLGLESLARAAATNRAGWEPDLCIWTYLTGKPPRCCIGEALKGANAGDYFRLLQYDSWRYRHSGTFPSFLTPRVQDNHSEDSASPLCQIDDVFHDMPNADLICHSCDGVEFRVHRESLSSASRLLRDRIQRLCSDTVSQFESTSTLPVLGMKERSTTLAALLWMCHNLAQHPAVAQPPTLTQAPLPPGLWGAIFTAARDYKMVEIQQELSAQWKAVARANPLDAYLSAARLEWRVGARLAAIYIVLLRLTFDQFSEMYSPLMELCPAFAYHQLLDFHRHGSSPNVNGTLCEAQELGVKPERLEAELVALVSEDRHHNAKETGATTTQQAIYGKSEKAENCEIVNWEKAWREVKVWIKQITDALLW